MKRYRETFCFVDTEKEAIEFCERINKSASNYMRKNKPATYNKWTNYEKTEEAFICWYYV